MTKPDPILRASLAVELDGEPSAILWPHDSESIPDDALIFRVAYLAPEWAGYEEEELRRRLDSLHRTWGQTRRQYRNGVAFAVPDAAALGAWDAASSTSAALAGLYRRVYLPRDGQAYLGETQFDAIAHVPPIAGERLHATIMRRLYPNFRHELSPEELAWTIGLGRRDCGGFHRLLFPMPDLARWFFVFLNLPRLRDPGAIRRAVAEGVRVGDFGLISGQGLLELDRLPKELHEKVAIRQEIAPEAVPFEAGSYLVWGGALK